MGQHSDIIPGEETAPTPTPEWPQNFSAIHPLRLLELEPTTIPMTLMCSDYEINDAEKFISRSFSAGNIPDWQPKKTKEQPNATRMEHISYIHCRFRCIYDEILTCPLPSAPASGANVGVDATGNFQ